MIRTLLLLVPALSAPALQAESVDQLIAKGRALLAEGRPSEAQVVFESAEKQDGATLRTRMWTLRSWLPQGRVNDALDQIDKLDHGGAKGPEMDYLYGMAFAFKAKGYIQERVPGGVVDMAFTDAVVYLEKAVKADPLRFSDAFAPLAESAWYARNLPLARHAADKACELTPGDPESHLLLGKVAHAQFVDANTQEGGQASADKHWDAAVAANTRAASILSTLGTPAAKARSAAPHVEMARLFGWRKKAEDAAREYGLAIGFDPGAVDFGEVKGALDGPLFVSALDSGAKGYATNWGAEDAGDAMILWWLGYAQLEQKQYEQAEAAFQGSLKKRPDFLNAWFYTAIARYHQRKYPEAIEAFRKNFADDPADLVRSIDQNRAYNLPILDYLIGWCDGKQRKLDAALLTEIEIAVVPDHAPYWNNLGLFYRDAGDLFARSKKEESKAQAKGLWEKSLVAYERAVAMSPEDPNYLNDLAVVLDYNLNRDLERAKGLYEKALARATEELARKDLTPELREIRKIAARDSKDNLEKLLKRIEVEKQKKEEGPAPLPEKKEQQ